jgi:hypothetical protein
MNRAFLVIGAMKAGTTSLFNDLVKNPAIHLPEKEPSYLTRYSVAEARAAYARLFHAARGDQLVGDASTGYSMIPRYTGVPERAAACFGSEVRILYLVRNPIHRALSHHYHALSYGEAHPDPSIALRNDPNFLAVSRYAIQLEPWLAVFPHDQIRVIVAEEYYAARRKTIAEICGFLSVACTAEMEGAWDNRGEDRRVGRWNIVRRSRWYRRHLAPRIPGALRAGATKLFLRAGPPRPHPPSLDCLEELREALIPDTEVLTRLMGRAVPPWDLTDTVRRLNA